MRCEGHDVNGERCLNQTVQPVVPTSHYCDTHQDQDGVEWVPPQSVQEPEVIPPIESSEASELDAQE